MSPQIPPFQTGSRLASGDDISDGEWLHRGQPQEPHLWPDHSPDSVILSKDSHSRCNNPKLALKLISELRREALVPNQFVFSGSVVACAKLDSVGVGRGIHAQVIVSGFESDIYVRTALVDMYSKFGDAGSAVSVFRQCPVEDAVMINSMVSGYVSFGSYEEALRLFGEVRRSTAFKPTESSFGGLIKACSELGKEVGEQLHGVILKTGFDSDCFVGTSLVDMYGKFGDVYCMKMVFECVICIDIALYNAMIVGCSKNGFDDIAIGYFCELRSQGLFPNECTFSSLLKACGVLRSFDLGRMTHGLVEKSSFRQDLVVNTALIDMYMKCGKVEDACTVFDRMYHKNTVSYNAMIYGHGQNENFLEAVSLFSEMNRRQLDIHHVTFVVLMGSCLGHEWCVYVHAIKYGFGSDLMVKSALLDTLIRRGTTNEALDLFGKMKIRNVVSWTTIISGMTLLGLHLEALTFFRTMMSSSITPNSFTFSAALKASGSLPSLEQGRCIHGCSMKLGIMDEFTNSALLDIRCGLVQNGAQLFELMSSKHGISPLIEHYVCMVDMFGRAGMLDRAKHFIMEMPFPADALVWTIFLASCKLHGNVELAQLAKDHVLRIRDEDNPTLVLMSGLYSEAGKWADAEKARNGIQSRGKGKEPGLSWIQISEEALREEVAAYPKLYNK
ncbi:hypothetical protein J5N97_010236 [Dioscorea zingiberensis]|uniref:Pentatricopeptide repeat-containing protein n=1 Tax=Dioscorea zingiberensis TaxID=325984 RepID=A0A9D5CYD0_9LILI|nr:hypothetical protein J5N97_010236 [Dioscorea zingiberensis]